MLEAELAALLVLEIELGVINILCVVVVFHLRVTVVVAVGACGVIAILVSILAAGEAGVRGPALIESVVIFGFLWGGLGRFSCVIGDRLQVGNDIGLRRRHGIVLVLLQLLEWVFLTISVFLGLLRFQPHRRKIVVVVARLLLLLHHLVFAAC